MPQNQVVQNLTEETELRTERAEVIDEREADEFAQMIYSFANLNTSFELSLKERKEAHGIKRTHLQHSHTLI